MTLIRRAGIALTTAAVMLGLNSLMSTGDTVVFEEDSPIERPHRDSAHLGAHSVTGDAHNPGLNPGFTASHMTLTAHRTVEWEVMGPC